MTIYENLRRLDDAEEWRDRYCELLAIARKVANKEEGLSALKAFRPHFDALYALFQRGEDSGCIQRPSNIVEYWAETTIGLLKLTEGSDGGQHIQIVGEFHVYYPD